MVPFYRQNAGKNAPFTTQAPSRVGGNKKMDAENIKNTRRSWGEIGGSSDKKYATNLLFWIKK